MSMYMRRRLTHGCITMLLLAAALTARAVEPGIAPLVEGVIDRLCAEFTPKQLSDLTTAQILERLTPEEHAAFAEGYWQFTVDQPAVVSVLRDAGQKEVPFWLAEKGFSLTKLRVRNEEYTYDVWQKAFPAGPVGLGVNGFDMHRPHYVVAVGPVEKGKPVKVTPVYPADQQLAVLQKGAYFYHDWPDLLVNKVPEELDGQVLLQTIRGRAREAHLIEGFRETPYPATKAPDQIMLTWQGDPRTTMAVQWRTDTSVTAGLVRWRAADSQECWREMPAAPITLHDRRILNNPTVHRFTAVMEGLTPGTEYVYTVGAPDSGMCSETATFTTAPEPGKPFSFLWLSDTHNRPENGALLQKTFADHPEAAFLTISGDLVGIGQYRNNYDELFGEYKGFIERRPLMPDMGNHDAIDGLGADLYLGSYALPENGPAALAPERAYSLRYGDALFLMLDVTEPLAPQAEWMKQVLKTTDARWKIAVFHFPPYFPDEEEKTIQDAWESTIDRYHVDLVLSGHVHHYLRTKPMRGGKVVDSEKDGTVYLVTVSIPDHPRPARKAPYIAAADFSGKALCELFTVDKDTITGKALDMDGQSVDTFTLRK